MVDAIETATLEPPMEEVVVETAVEPGPEVVRLAPEPTAVDTHCHLFLLEEDAGAVVHAAQDAGVGRMICVGIDPETSRRSIELAESFRGVFATVGVHPHSASEFDRRAGSSIEELLANRLVVAVGETGLDYYRRLSSPSDQERCFRSHIALARETGKPIVVHVRDAWPDALSILEEEGAERVVLHCFSGDTGVAEEARARGYFVSFAGNVTYPGAGPLREVALTIPEERLLVETDSPYLAPQAVRGRPNSPSNLLEIVKALSEAREVGWVDLAASTTVSAEAAFPGIV